MSPQNYRMYPKRGLLQKAIIFCRVSKVLIALIVFPILIVCRILGWIEHKPIYQVKIQDSPPVQIDKEITIGEAIKTDVARHALAELMLKSATQPTTQPATPIPVDALLEHANIHVFRNGVEDQGHYENGTWTFDGK